MGIRLKKNFKRFYFKSFYFKRILKSKIKRYNSFLKLYNSAKSLSQHSFRRRNKKGKFRVKKLRLGKFKRALFVKRLYKLGYKKRYFFCYLRQRIESIRLKKFLVKYRWRNKQRLWKRIYRRGFKRLYFRFFKKKSINFTARHFRTANSFYKSHGLYFFLKNFVKYSRLKLVLARYGKIFKNKKKKVICKLSKDRVEKLILLNIFFQGLTSRGKKKLSISIFKTLFLLLKFKYKRKFIDCYLQFLEKVRPLIYYKVMFIGGKKI